MAEQALQDFRRINEYLRDLAAHLLLESESRLGPLRVLIDRGYTLKDIARLTGLSSGRVQQLANRLPEE